MSSDIWNIERDLCRCCHSEGIFTNLAEPRGRDHKEIYSDMLKDCFDINILPVPGALCEVTYTICEACILRLKDAFEFKRQVQVCEEKFKHYYNRNAIKVENENYNELIVKVEMPESLSDFKDDCSNDDDDYLEYDTKVKRIPKVNSSTKAKSAGKAKIKVKTEKSSPKTRTKSLKGKTTADDGVKKKGSASEEAGRNYTLTEDEDGKVFFNCNTCMKSFKRRELYMQHYLHVHLKLRPKLRTCNVCRAKVPPHLRAEHMDKMHGVPPPTCGACGKTFAFPGMVIRHQRVDHMGEKSFECSYCCKKFPIRSYLKKHEVKHLPVKEFLCAYCNKAFKWKKNVVTHLRIHLNERPYACRVCGETFVQLASLKYHLSKKHTDVEY